MLQAPLSVGQPTVQGTPSQPQPAQESSCCGWLIDLIKNFFLWICSFCSSTAPAAPSLENRVSVPSSQPANPTPAPVSRPANRAPVPSSRAASLIRCEPTPPPASFADIVAAHPQIQSWLNTDGKIDISYTSFVGSSSFVLENRGSPRQGQMKGQLAEGCVSAFDLMLYHYKNLQSQTDHNYNILCTFSKHKTPREAVTLTWKNFDFPN